jgi:nucleoside-diphosphate-sugar epimerase
VKTALVAGGAGFIGSNLCARLVRDGVSVVCVDNMITGRRTNVEPLLRHSRFRLIEHDLSERLSELPPVDRVFHLASPASPPAYLRYPVETMRVNSEGTLHLLELAQRNCARFLYASTSEAYGDPLEHPQQETSPTCTNPVGPRSMYHEAKRYGEALTSAYERSRDVDARIVRIFNTYGPNSDPDDGRLVPNFIRQALAGESLTVYGEGQQTRSLCYVSDMVEGLVRAMECDDARGQVVNLGNPEEHTVLEFAHLIREITGSASSIRLVDPITGEDPTRRRPDISKARALLGWQPVVPLQEGIKATITYFRGVAPPAETALVEAR